MKREVMQGAGTSKRNAKQARRDLLDARQRFLVRVQGGMKKSKALKAAMAGVLQPADLSSAPDRNLAGDRER